MVRLMGLIRLIFRLLTGARLPTSSGALQVSGANAEITIRRTRQGVPLIEAASETDGWFGLGFCQGQDRSYQIDELARAASGTLSEILGPPGLRLDRFARHIGFRRVAEQQLERVPDGVRAAVEAFARGLEAGRQATPQAHEHLLLRSSPAPFTAVDCLAILGLQAMALANNWDVELNRLAVLLSDGEAALRDLEPGAEPSLAVTTPAGSRAGSPGSSARTAAVSSLTRELAEKLATFRASFGAAEGGASNNWALAGSRTATGTPMLANDPHLAPRLAPPFYLARVTTPEWSVAGASFAGGPAFPAGHNGYAAWGVTAGLADTCDLFVEHFDPSGKRVLCDGEMIDVTVHREVIRVKGADDVVEEILETRHGPVISPVLDLGEDGQALGVAIGMKRHAVGLALAATWRAPRPMVGLLGFHRVRGFQDLRDAASQWPSVSLNVVYADRDGTIGYQLMGDVPERGASAGNLPTDGTRTAHDWAAEPLPFDAMPSEQDPDCGFVASANNQPITTEGGTGALRNLGTDWLDGYRVSRIVEVLADAGDWTVRESATLQRDLLSLPWRRLRAPVLEALASAADSDRQVAQAHRILTAWDGNVVAHSAAATLFELTLFEMIVRTVRRRAPESWRQAMGAGASPLASVTMLGFRRIAWFIRLLETEPPAWLGTDWQTLIIDSARRMIGHLASKRGRGVGGWRWGHVRPHGLRHTFGGRSRLFSVIFDRGPFAIGGDSTTVAQASVRPTDPLRPPGAIPALRMVIDLASPDQSTFALPGGQSGNPCSPHYDDQIAAWRDGPGLRIAWSDEAVGEDTVETLVLSPTPLPGS